MLCLIYLFGGVISEEEIVEAIRELLVFIW